MSQTRILVVEDEAIIASSIQRKLEKMGLEVPFIASSGEEAIRQAANIQPDLVLMNIMLDGPATCAATQIWQRFNIPVIYLVANSEQQTSQGGKSAESFGYLLNSFSERDLHAAIEGAFYKQRMENKLRESEERLVGTLNSISEAVVTTDVYGHITFMNSVAERLTGWKQSDALGKALNQVMLLVDEESGNLLESPLTLLLPPRPLTITARAESGPPSPTSHALRVPPLADVVALANDTILIGKDGIQRALEGQATALTTSSHEGHFPVIGVVLAFRDITERKRAERERAEQRELIRDITERKQAEEERRRFTNQLRTAADLAHRINAILDLDSLLAETVTELHSRFVIGHVHIYLLDESRQELVMRRGSGDVAQAHSLSAHPIPLSRQENLVARAARQQELVLLNDVRHEPTFMPNPLLPDTRSEVAVPLIVGGRVLAVLHLQDNQPQRFTPSELDVLRTLAGQVAIAIQNARLFEQTQQNLDETQRTAERLRELDQLKSEFLASMSHELRTPLNSIIGYSEIILMGLNGPLTKEMTEDMEAIRHSGQHLLHLINDILDLAKIEAGHMTLGYEEVELSGLLDQVHVRHRSLLHDKPVELFIEMEQNVPPVEADRVRLNQILTNLVTNAIKFTEKGIVRLHTSHDDGWLQIAVQDEGIGIKKSDLATIFEQFRQVDGSNTRRAGGTGLGLAITNHLVQLHGGTITVESELGKGSTFFVRLPVKRLPEDKLTSQEDISV